MKVSAAEMRRELGDVTRAVEVNPKWSLGPKMMLGFVPASSASESSGREDMPFCISKEPSNEAVMWLRGRGR